MTNDACTLLSELSVKPGAPWTTASLVAEPGTVASLMTTLITLPAAR